MRRTFAVFFTLLLLISLVGCETVSQSLKLAVCGSYGVPGMMCFDLKGDSFSCEIKETDSYGRILFSYAAYNQFDQEDAVFLVVCQQTDAECVFYYEDICYIRDTADVTLIEGLKKRNDWNEPLNNEKMTTRSIDISVDLVLQTDSMVDAAKIEKLFCQMADIKENNIYDKCLVDKNHLGQALFVVLVNDNEGMQRYLIFSDTEYRICWILLNEASQYEDQVSTFKRQNGWSYAQ